MTVPSWRMLALDLDDTVLEDDTTLRDDCAAALASAAAAGVELVVATGRMARSAEPYARQLDLDPDSCMITYNGALVRTVAGETIRHRPVPTRWTRALIRAAEETGLCLQLYIDDRLYVREVDERVRYYQQIAQVDVEAVGDLQSVLAWGDSTKCLFIGDEEQIDEALPVLQQRFPALEIGRSKPRFIEVTRAGVHKLDALSIVAARYDVPLSAVMAIGDSDNDVEMLAGVGLGVAVANAGPRAAAAADLVTSLPRGAGVAEAIQRFLLS